MSTPWNLWVKQMVLILECLIQLNSTTKGAHVGLFSLYFWPCLVKLYRTWLQMGCDNLSEKQLTYKPPPPPTPFLKVGCQSFLSSFFESEVKLSLIKPWLFLFLVVRSKSFWGGGTLLWRTKKCCCCSEWETICTPASLTISHSHGSPSCF